MKQYVNPTVKIYTFESNSDVITLSIGTSNDNKYSDMDWDV